MGDIRDEWRLRDIEVKADEAKRRLYEIDALRSDVGRMEHTIRELRADIDGLRSELSTAQTRLNEAEQRLQILTEADSL